MHRAREEWRARLMRTAIRNVEVIPRNAHYGRGWSPAVALSADRDARQFTKEGPGTIMRAGIESESRDHVSGLVLRSRRFIFRASFISLPCFSTSLRRDALIRKSTSTAIIYITDAYFNRVTSQCSGSTRRNYISVYEKST